MANTKNNIEQNFDIMDFKKTLQVNYGENDSEAGLVGASTLSKPAIDAVSSDIPDFDFSVDGIIDMLTSSLDILSKLGDMVGSIGKFLNDFLSGLFLGGTLSLRDKAGMRNYFKENCMGTGNDTVSRFGQINVNLQEFSLLALILALLCAGMNKAIGAAYGLLDGMLPDGALDKVLPIVMSIAKGDDTLTLVGEISDLTAGRGDSVLGDTVGKCTTLYGKFASTRDGVQSIGKMKDSFDKMKPDWGEFKHSVRDGAGGMRVDKRHSIASSIESRSFGKDCRTYSSSEPAFINNTSNIVSGGLSKIDVAGMFSF